MTDSRRENLELKAADSAPRRTLDAAISLGCRQVGLLRQRDTYFHARFGRLKLREEWPGTAHLIQYERDDEASARQSSYRIAVAADPGALLTALHASMGTKLVIEKRRRLLLFDNVRVHLDQVTGLGSFVELEAVVPAGSDVEDQRATLTRVRDALGIRDHDLIGSSYSDLLVLGLAA